MAIQLCRTNSGFCERSTALELFGLRYDAKSAAIRQALDEGKRSGNAEDYSLEGLLAELDAESE